MELDSDVHLHNIKGLGYTPITNVTTHIMEEVAQEFSKSEAHGVTHGV